MGTNGPLEALQKWREMSQWMVTSWSTQAKAVVSATDPDTQATAVRNGLALAVTSSVQLAATALGTAALLTEPTEVTTYREYRTAGCDGERTLVVENDLVASKDANCIIVQTAVALRPGTLADGARDFVVLTTTKGLTPDEYAGVVRVLDAAGVEIERVAIGLLV